STRALGRASPVDAAPRLTDSRARGGTSRRTRHDRGASRRLRDLPAAVECPIDRCGAVCRCRRGCSPGACAWRGGGVRMIHFVTTPDEVFTMEDYLSVRGAALT